MKQGAPLEAETWAREACETLRMIPVPQIVARTCLSTALLAQGRVQESVAEAEQGVRVLEQIGGTGVTSVGAWLALAEACQAQGGDAASERALRQALECLSRRSRDLPDTAALERFLRQVPENARLLQLARQRWGEDLGGEFAFRSLARRS
jgi:hypothetical protein